MPVSSLKIGMITEIMDMPGVAMPSLSDLLDMRRWIPSERKQHMQSADRSTRGRWEARAPPPTLVLFQAGRPLYSPDRSRSAAGVSAPGNRLCSERNILRASCAEPGP